MTLKSIRSGSIALLVVLSASADEPATNTKNKPAAGVVARSGSGKTTASQNGGTSTATRKPEVDVSYQELVVLYKNKDNPIIQKFSLYGEFAAQWASGSSNQGTYGSWDLPPLNGFPSSLWDAMDVRRWRLGARADLLRVFRFTGIIDINPNWNPFYRDIYELYLTYAPNEAFNLSAGKRKAHFFTQEYNTPSRELIVFEQSLLTGALIPRELTGVWVTGRIDHWSYALAVYAGDYETEFSQFDAGAVIQTSIGYDFASALKFDKALVRFDWQNSTSALNSSGPRNFTNGFSLNSTWQQGRFYGYTDFLGGIGRGTQGNVWGVTLTPTWFLIPNHLQFVLRYQYAHGEDASLKLPTRYEALAPDLTVTTTTTKNGQTTTSTKIYTNGSDYSALYFGLNYYIYRHNLKLMTGVEYSSMTGGPKDFSGWTYLAGLRAAF